MIDYLRRSGEHSGAAFWTKVAVCLTDLHEIRYVGSIASPAADGRRIAARAAAQGQSGPTRQHPDAAASRPNPAPETRTEIGPIITVDLAAKIANKGRLAIGPITRPPFEELLVGIKQITPLFSFVCSGRPGTRIINDVKTQ